MNSEYKLKINQQWRFFQTQNLQRQSAISNLRSFVQQKNTLFFPHRCFPSKKLQPTGKQAVCPQKPFPGALESGEASLHK